MAGTLITVTDIGRAALVAQGNDGTSAHRIVEIGLASAPFTADKAMKALPGERKRIRTFAGENVAPDTIHVTLKDDTDDQFTLYGFGLYLDNGVLVAAWGQATPIMEKSAAAMLLLSADVQFTTIDAAQLVFGDASFTNPPATTERQGVIELATQAETDAGADDARAITPKTAAKRYAALTGAALTGQLDVATTPTDTTAQINARGAGGAPGNEGKFRLWGTFTNPKGTDFGQRLIASIRAGFDAGSWGREYLDFWLNNGAPNDAMKDSLQTRVMRLVSGGRVLIGPNVTDDGKALQVDGDVSINRKAGEGHIFLGNNDGYFYASGVQAGWYSPTKGSFRYDFGAQNLFIGANNYPAWHAGNLNPLDKGTGGTIGGDVTFAKGKRLFLDEGSAASPSLTFVNDGAPDTGLYHINDGSFGVTCNTVPTVTFTPSVTTFNRPVTGPTPPAGDNSILLSTTAWVTSAIASASIGQIVMEPRATVRAGFLKANGALVNRADYPALWAYAQASGALVADATWGANNFGCFSTGDGATTFRLPELRGEFLRCWDDGRGVDSGRGIGSWQDNQNRQHAHGASAAAVGDHAHSAWTDTQGWHGHHGNTAGVGDHQHVVPYGENTGFPWGVWAGGQQGSKGGLDGDNNWPYTSASGAHAHSFDTEGSGNHGHNVGIGGAGNHSHTITINADGGNEARPRNIALLAMIRAY